MVRGVEKLSDLEGEGGGQKGLVMVERMAAAMAEARWGRRRKWKLGGTSGVSHGGAVADELSRSENAVEQATNE